MPDSSAGMADFQVLAPKIKPELGTPFIAATGGVTLLRVDALQGFERDNQPMYLVPPVISRDDIPKDYGCVMQHPPPLKQTIYP